METIRREEQARDLQHRCCRNYIASGRLFKPTPGCTQSLSWSRSQGLFAGLALEEATLREDLDVYDEPVIRIRIKVLHLVLQLRHGLLGNSVGFKHFREILFYHLRRVFREFIGIHF